jgi:hypothetical protein
MARPVRKRLVEARSHSPIGWLAVSAGKAARAPIDQGVRREVASLGHAQDAKPECERV